MDPVQETNPVTLPVTIRVWYPKIQALALLIISVALFANSKYFQKYKEDEAMRMFDLLLIALILIATPTTIVMARIRLVERIGIWGFALVKAVTTVCFFYFFRWVGKILLPEKDLVIAISSITFFLYLLSLRVIHQVSDDFGAAQGFLTAGYTLVISEYQHLQLVWLSAIFTFLLALMNIPLKSNQHPPQDEVPQVALVDMARGDTSSDGEDGRPLIGVDV